MSWPCKPRAGMSRHRFSHLAVLVAFFSTFPLSGSADVAATKPVAANAAEQAGQRLPLAGVHNFRDLGGYRTADGRRLRNGLLFRSSELSNTTVEDRSLLQHLGIRTICDFRSDAERKQAPDPQLPGWSFEQRCHSTQVAGASDQRFSELTAARKAGQEIDWAGLLTQFYAAMPDQFVGQYRAMFEHLVEHGDQPLLFHCTAGKDRTGIAAALILLALEVPEQTAMQDYLLSNRYRSENGAGLAGFPPELKRVPALVEVREAYLQAALHSMRTRYGSVDAYLEQALGLNAERRARLRANLLEPAAPTP